MGYNPGSSRPMKSHPLCFVALWSAVLFFGIPFWGRAEGGAPVEVVPATPARIPEGGVRIPVTAKDYWVDTGVVVGNKDTVRISANGLWKANAREKMHNADGTRYVATENLDGFFYNGIGGREGQLIGRLGREGKPFVVGTTFKETVVFPVESDPSPLYLAFNGNPHDDRKGHAWENHEGEQEVTIVVERFRSL